MTIHPKTGGAALGGALGTVIVAVLGSIHGIHLTPAADGAIPTFLSTLGAFLVPAPGDTGPTSDQVATAISILKDETKQSQETPK